MISLDITCGCGDTGLSGGRHTPGLMVPGIVGREGGTGMREDGDITGMDDGAVKLTGNGIIEKTTTTRGTAGVTMIIPGMEEGSDVGEGEESEL